MITRTDSYATTDLSGITMMENVGWAVRHIMPAQLPSGYDDRGRTVYKPGVIVVFEREAPQ